ncbi:hypothetical protein BX600DRAFT_178888 [Xylariales sp. PMI_506]|nr:hypothetical protein BX600DRAFT_178888 [Xylariales sp. PMI_506]
MENGQFGAFARSPLNGLQTLYEVDCHPLNGIPSSLVERTENFALMRSSYAHICSDIFQCVSCVIYMYIYILSAGRGAPYHKRIIVMRLLSYNYGLQRLEGWSLMRASKPNNPPRHQVPERGSHGNKLHVAYKTHVKKFRILTEAILFRISLRHNTSVTAETLQSMAVGKSWAPQAISTSAEQIRC